MLGIAARPAVFEVAGIVTALAASSGVVWHRESPALRLPTGDLKRLANL